MEPGRGENEEQPTTEVEIRLISTADSPRVVGEDPEHIRALAASRDELPPIIVHRATMRVVDGRHRLRAARLRGRKSIAVRFFDGTEADAFVLAVQANVTHGLPLSLADRRRSAARIALSHPTWSDRRIATVTGLSPGTVTEIRRRGPAGPGGQAGAGSGHAGRVHPLDRDRGRMLGSDLRLADAQPTDSGDGGDEGAVKPLPSCPDQSAAIVERLRADPALRLSEPGRYLLRLLNVATLRADDWDRIIDNLPPHCSGVVVQVAKACAGVWGEVAERTERRGTDVTCP
ncbi:ParB N-terminal domain-containing protein [Streptomyces sp. B6B3]|uniref:ParB N-terminal domain-containing protein n=1 Tax=Streptomyces sp. B6B3 TaxID=3153570 RepID=UPI00325CC70E